MLAASACAGAVVGLAAPPTNLYVAVWLGMVGLVLLLGDRVEHAPARTGWRAFAARIGDGVGRGLLFGTGANLVALRFVPHVVVTFTPLSEIPAAFALVLLALFEGGRWAVAGWVTRALTRGGMPLPPAFAMGVYAGTFVPTVFPWTVAGGVTPWLPMVQLADTIGERGVAGLMALLAGLVGRAVMLARARSARVAATNAVAAGALAVAMFLYGARRIAEVEARRASAPTTKVGLVQPAFEARERWAPGRAPALLRALTELTHIAEQRGAHMTIWPESAYPYPIPHDSRRVPSRTPPIVGPGVRGPIMTGLVMVGPHGSYNSVAIATADNALSPPYDKLHLLWFGETVPLADKSRWLRETFARGVGLVPGDERVLLTSGDIRAGVLNCFEDTLPDAGREAARLDPNLLVNVTNDAWFAGTAEGELHLRLSAMRAIELRRDLVRAVNLGPTSWIGATGRVLARYHSPAAGVLLAEPALLEGDPTFYARFGDTPTALATALAGGALVIRRRRRP